MFDTPKTAPMVLDKEYAPLPKSGPEHEPTENSSLEELTAYALNKQAGIFAREKMNAHDLWLMGQALSWAKPKVGHTKWEKWWKDKGFKKTYVWQARKLHENAATLEEVKDLGVTEALVKFGVVAEKKEKPTAKGTPIKKAAPSGTDEPSDHEEAAVNEEAPTAEAESTETAPIQQEPNEQVQDEEEPEKAPADELAEEEDKELREYQSSLRSLTPNTRAVAILHALELLRDDLNGSDVDTDLRSTFTQIAALAEQLKGPRQETECSVAA